MFVLSLAMTVVWASTALAEEPAAPNYARSGYYLGLAGTAAFENFHNTGGNSVDDTVGLNARAGYRINETLATELEFEWAQDFQFDGSGGTSADIYSLTLNGKYYFLPGRIQPLVVGGVGYAHADVSGGGVDASPDDLTFRFGGGVDFYATEHIVLQLEATYFIPPKAWSMTMHDLQYTSLSWGAAYRF